MEISKKRWTDHSMSTTYIAIRDDASSQSVAERDFIVGNTQLRVDGRRRTERRPVALQLTRAENTATALVRLGAGTRVTCTVTAELVPPLLDRPNEGSVALTVDISPAANTTYRVAAPASTAGGGGATTGGPHYHVDRHQKLKCNRILRCLERCLLQGGALDTEALCVVPGQYVWKLNCAVTILDDSGNLTDAAALACLAAVRHYRKPVIEHSNSDSSTVPVLVPSNLKEPTPLPLHHTPLAISFALFDVTTSTLKGVNKSERIAATSSTTATVVALIDPTVREELCQTGSLTIAMNVHGEICLLDFSGGSELSVADLRACHDQASVHIQPLCQSLETALQQADQQALQERLAQLQVQRGALLPSLPPLTDDSLDEPPWPFVSDGGVAVPMDPVRDHAVAAQDAEAASEEDETYRRQALDYNLGHVATKVRENQLPPPPSSAVRGNSLLAAMLQSVQGCVTEGESASRTKEDTSTPSAEPIPSMPIVEELPPVKLSQNILDSEAFVMSKTTNNKLDQPPAMTVDSDEEETTMQLKSEFDQSLFVASSDAAVAKKPSLVNEDDVDDLAAAIKSKKKKKGGKK